MFHPVFMPPLSIRVHTCLIGVCVDCLRNIAEVGEFKMWDVACVIASVVFFLIAIAYTQGCERLATKAGK